MHLKQILHPIILLTLAGPWPARGFALRVEPSEPMRGDPVTITCDALPAETRVSGQVETPSGAVIDLHFAAGPGGRHTATFADTDDVAFLQEPWGAYRVRVRAADPSGASRSEETVFHLNQASKTLYAVLWIDDFGAGGELPPDFIAWYHEHAGPISYVLQRDDTHFFKLDSLLKRYDFNHDYLGHHLQSMRWAGARWRLALNDWVYAPYERFRMQVNRSAGFQLLRAVYLVGLLLLLAGLGGWIYLRSRRKAALLVAGAALLLAALLLALRANFTVLDDWRNWTFEIANRSWRLEALERAREDFRSQGMDFPPVIRHAWNLPPEGSMDDYMERFGVLADASAVRGMGTNAFLRIAYGVEDRVIVWPDRVLPYYASRSLDYNETWNGNEEDRGLLELPLTFHGAARLTWDASCEEIMHRLPHGALTAVYIHPGESTRTVKQWAGFLTENYPRVRFIRADAYMKLYMSHDPRPVWLDEYGTAHWAFVRNGQLIPIRPTEQVRLLPGSGDTPGTVRDLLVDTRSPLPLLSIPLPPGTGAVRLGRSEPRAAPAGQGARVRFENVPPGRHRLLLLPAGSSPAENLEPPPKETSP